MPPNPPAGSGPHRYQFYLFEQSAPALVDLPGKARNGFDLNEFISENSLGSAVAAFEFRTENVPGGDFWCVDVISESTKSGKIKLQTHKTNEEYKLIAGDMWEGRRTFRWTTYRRKYGDRFDTMEGHGGRPFGKFTLALTSPTFQRLRLQKEDFCKLDRWAMISIVFSFYW